jgi:hypothetical protein
MITRRAPLRRSWLKRGPKKVRRFIKTLQRDRERAERRADAAETKARALCRYVTYMRAHGACEHCGQALVLRPKDARHEFEIAHVHEEPPRSLGGDPLDPSITVLLCVFCHERVTHHRINIKWRDPELKAVRPSGPIFAVAA